jgi:hypothetical protein
MCTWVTNSVTARVGRTMCNYPVVALVVFMICTNQHIIWMEGACVNLC